MKKVMTVAIAALVMAGTTMAGAEPRTYLGGAFTCGGWTQAHNSNDTSAMTIQRAYVSGYISGVNFSSSYPDLLKDSTGNVEAYMGFIDNYCRANPLDKLVDAADALIVELYRRFLKP